MDPRAREMILPFGVKTKTSGEEIWKRSVSMKSSLLASSARSMVSRSHERSCVERAAEDRDL